MKLSEMILTLQAKQRIYGDLTVWVGWPSEPLPATASRISFGEFSDGPEQPPHTLVIGPEGLFGEGDGGEGS